MLVMVDNSELLDTFDGARSQLLDIGIGVNIRLCSTMANKAVNTVMGINKWVTLVNQFDETMKIGIDCDASSIRAFYF